jgi:hypothetical protein
MSRVKENRYAHEVAACWGPVPAEGPKSLTPKDFKRLHQMIKPQPGESRFLEIPWVLSLWEARQKAARAGKPILVWAGGWGVPIGTC